MGMRNLQVMKLRVLLTAAVTALLCGCAAPESKKPWVAPQRVAWSDVATEPVESVENGYRIVQSDATEGLFPCALAVSRIAAETPRTNAGGSLAAPSTPHNEFLIWNTSFDNLPAVSEAFPVVERDLGEYPVEPQLILSAARAFHAGLSLIYAVNQLAPEKYEMLGVLHDTKTGKPIAVFHTVNETIIRPKNAKKAHNNVDAWEYEARALARLQFKSLALACFRELIAHDVPQRQEPPEGWTPNRPLAPMHWPPRYYGP